MKCPKCDNEEIKEQVSIVGRFKKKKIITYYCPLCDYKNEHVFAISKWDMQTEDLNRINKEKRIRMIYDKCLMKGGNNGN